MKLRELVEDVHYFIRDFSYIANQAPLQLYASALTFAPESSQVKSLFKDCMPRWLVLPPKVADVWSIESLVLEGHTSSISGMSFSSCGKYLATCAYGDKILRVWDSATGDCTLKIPMPEHAKTIAVTFSHDNKCLAAGYLGHRRPLPFSAIIYDTETGNLIETYVCRDVGWRKWAGLAHLAFVPGSSNTLFVASILDKGRLEVWCTKLASHTFEKAWGISIGMSGQFIISASNSLVSSFSHNDCSIASWQLESGAFVSSHSIDLGDNHFGGFIDCQGRDLVYLIRSKLDERRLIGKNIVEKLNVQTGQVDLITYMEAEWRPEAISLKTGAIACTKHRIGVVYMFDLLQCPKTNKLTRYESSWLVFASVSQNGKMILLAYGDHIELRDLSGNIVFQSPKVSFVAYLYGKFASVSGDGSVVSACLGDGARVWFVKSGRELRLPYMEWPCSPEVSGDGKLMSFFSRTSFKSSEGNVTDVHSQYDMVERILLWDLENNQEVKVVDTFLSPGAWMFFSTDGKTLHTEKGNIELETGDWTTDTVHVPENLKRSISDDSSWLRLNGQDMLWLPGSYRPQDREGKHFGKNTIAYSCQDGSVVVMQCVDPCE